VRHAIFFRFTTVSLAVVALLFVGLERSSAALDPTELVKAGYSLTQSEAEGLENALGKKPNDEAARLKLLG
jgi:hypothetical protein